MEVPGTRTCRPRGEEGCVFEQMEAGLARLVWASLDDFLPPEEGFHYVGRNVVNYSFFRALLKYGHFDEYHFFLANGAHRRFFEARHGQFLDRLGVRDRVRLFDRIDLPRQTRQTDYTVFHQSDHITFFNALCHFRNQVGAFPVTAFIHSLSYQPFMTTYLQMLFGGVTSSDSLICSSASGKEVLEKCFERMAARLNRSRPRIRMEVIPFGVDGEQFGHLDRRKCRNELGLDQGDVIALCFSRFSDYDKMDLLPLLQAFRRASEGNRPWRLILAGAVHSEEYLRILRLWALALGVADKVTFLINLSEGEKARLYRSADFFVSVSDNPQETFGLTLLEAMASGLPLLVSDFDGYREIVTDEIGRRIPTTWGHFEFLDVLGPLMDQVTFHRYLGQSVCVDVEELADALACFFSNPSRCREIGEAARQRFLREYDYPVVIEKMETLWVELKTGFRLGADGSREDPLNLNVFQCFSHYVSRHLSPDMKIRLTPFGRNLLDSHARYPLLPEMASLIDHEKVRAMMKRAETPCSVGEITEEGQDGEWRSRYLLLWMLKHGLLQFLPENDPGKSTGRDS